MFMKQLICDSVLLLFATIRKFPFGFGSCLVAKPVTVGWTMSPYVAVTPGLQEAGNQVPLLDRRDDSDTRTGHHPITEAYKSQQV